MSKKDDGLFSKSSFRSPGVDILYNIKKGFKYIFQTGIFTIFVFIFVDQLSKQLAQYYLSFVDNKSVVIIPNLLNFTLVYNDGAAFGSMAGNRVFLIGSSLILGTAMIVFLSLFFRKISRVGRASLYMMIGGCLGNFIDRAFYPGGLVVDFIQFEWFFGFKNFAVFNLADTFLVVGIAVFIIGEICFLIYELINNKKKLHNIYLEQKKEENYEVKLTKSGIVVFSFDDDDSKKVNLLQEYSDKKLEEISSETVNLDSAHINKLKGKLNGKQK